MFRLGSCAPRMRTLLVSTEFQHLVRCQLQRLFEILTDLDERLFARIVAAFSFACRASPQTDAEESLANIDDHSHDFVVGVLL